MRGTNTVMINGRAYDATTGLPASALPAAPTNSKGKFFDIGPRPAGTAHNQMHRQVQKSQTLYRAALKRPETTNIQQPQPKAASTRSPLIQKFAPIAAQQESPTAPTQEKTVAKPLQTPKVPSSQPIERNEVKETKPAQSNAKLKETLIRQRIAEAEAAKKSRPKQGRLKSFLARQPKIASIMTVTLALLLLGGYITYINLPNLSVRVAAAQAGINASYPEYQPDGYSLHGPVAYAPGEVTLSFASNSNNDQNYTIKQRASSWDSQAVLDNYVSKETSTYLTYSEHGLTVYTYGSKAAWVNGGILYTLGGNAPLSSEQVLKIAASM